MMGEKQYCYKCLSCGFKICGTLDEIGKDFTCPWCKEFLIRDYKAERTSFILDGPGFYSTDYRDRQEV